MVQAPFKQGELVFAKIIILKTLYSPDIENIYGEMFPSKKIYENCQNVIAFEFSAIIL